MLVHVNTVAIASAAALLLACMCSVCICCMRRMHRASRGACVALQTLTLLCGGGSLLTLPQTVVDKLPVVDVQNVTASLMPVASLH